MKDPKHYQQKMAYWLLQAQEATTRKRAKKCLRKYSKHQRRYFLAYTEGIQEEQP